MPYKGIESAIKKVKENTNDKIVLDMLEFCTVKILTGLVTNMYKNCNQQIRKEICKYCYYIIHKYFPDINRNPFIKLRCLDKLPYQHRVAVKLFVIAYRIRMIYPFSTFVAILLRLQEKFSRGKA